MSMWVHNKHVYKLLKMFVYFFTLKLLKNYTFKYPKFFEYFINNFLVYFQDGLHIITKI